MVKEWYEVEKRSFLSNDHLSHCRVKTFVYSYIHFLLFQRFPYEIGSIFH